MEKERKINPLLQTISILLFLSSFHTTTGVECGPDGSYKCWNAKAHDVTSPSHFLIDTIQERIILTAKNSVCHISLDLSSVENIKNVTPSTATMNSCTGLPRYEDPAKCHNFHHILLLPTMPSPSNQTMIGNTPLNNTVLECGSNAFQPRCNYRMRSDLSSVSDIDGKNYIPYDGGYDYTKALWLSTGRLMSATQQISQQFRLVMSDIPFNGPVNVGTVSQGFDARVQFVSMYEIGEYVYTFFREQPDEVAQQTIYSRVSRVCKVSVFSSSSSVTLSSSYHSNQIPSSWGGQNDTGVPDPSPLIPLEHNIFTTFLKARMTCVSGDNEDTPYYYNELQDTYLVESESETDGSIQRDLYTIFTSPENGPEGSALCVFSFGVGGGDGPSLESVFDGDYLKENNNREHNQNPFSCSEGRTADDANTLYLMSGTVEQTTTNKLHLQLTGYSFRKILVTTVTDLSGTAHEVFYIAGTKEGQLVLLKILYDSAKSQSHIISELELQNSPSGSIASATTTMDSPVVTKMELLGNGTSVATDAVFVGTTETLYRVPIANCLQYSGNCLACIAARDPHCAYNPSTSECVAIDKEENMSGLLQSVADGDVATCTTTTGATPTSSEKPTAPTDDGKTDSPKISAEATPIPSVRIVTPAAGGLTPTRDSQNNLGVYIATPVAFILGLVVGVFFLGFCVRYKDRFHWGKLLSGTHGRRTTRHDRGEIEELQFNSKAASDKEINGAAGACNVMTSKAEQFGRNNFEPNPIHGGTTVVHIDTISNLGHSNHYRSNGKIPAKGSSPPPYSPKKASELPSNGVGMMSSVETKFGETTPTKTDPCSPDEKIPFSPLEKQNRVFPLKASETPPQTTPPKQLMSPIQTTPTTSPTTTPLALVPGRYPYRRSQSQSQAPPPGQAHFATLPTKKRHYSTSTSTSSSETTPTKRPSSAEAPPNLTLPRLSSAQNINHAPLKQRGVATATTPTKQRHAGGSPFNAHHHGGAGVPLSPYGGGSSLGTPTSTCSGSSRGGVGGPRHFKFPPGKVVDVGGATPSHHLSRGNNPNVKATGYAVEPVTNHDRITYGSNVDPKTHTIDRKNKFQNGHTYRGLSPPVTSPHHPETTFVEVNGSVVGCTDC